jgi:hypothetical protein
MTAFEELSELTLANLTVNLTLPRQQTLLRVLLDKDAEIAKMYVGAIEARGAQGNPDHVSQACHSMRELIDNVPKYFAIPVEGTGSMGTQVQLLREQWDREPRVRNGSDDQLTPGFVLKLTEFFEWLQANRPKRLEVAKVTIRALDVSERRLPDPIEQIRAREWMEIRQFFITGTHHGSCTLEEFDTWAVVFEEFILALTKPRTFETATAIDALVAEGEADA